MRSRAYGSSYLFRQRAGSERIGGLTVMLTPKEAEVGEISVQLTDWESNEPIGDNCGWSVTIVEAAVLGANEAAASLNLLNEFDLKLYRFLLHEIDSGPPIFRQAAKSACRSALEAWRQRDL
jgi:hypothetical protein